MKRLQHHIKDKLWLECWQVAQRDIRGAYTPYTDYFLRTQEQYQLTNTIREQMVEDLEKIRDIGP